MKTKITLLLALALASKLAGQQFTWAKQFGINSTFNGQAVTADAQGNVYFTGSFSGSGDQDPSPGTFVLNSNGSGDIYVAKTNSSGNLIWLKSVGAGWADNGSAIAVDNSGNVYVAGNFRNTVDFDPGAGSYTISSPVQQNIFDSDAFILKLDMNGNFVWAGSISGERDEYITGMKLFDNKLYVTGFGGKTIDFDISASGTHTLYAAQDRQAFAASFDLDGDLQWVSMVEGSSEGAGISLDQDGKVYVTGHFGPAADFDPSPAVTTLTSAGGNDLFVWKLDGNGALLWARGTGGTHHEYGYDVVATTANVFVTGYFQGTTDFNPSATATATFAAVKSNEPLDSGADMYVLSLTSGGDYVWAYTAGSIGFDHGDEILIDKAGYLYVGGVFNYTVDFDPTYNEAILNGNNMEQVFLIKLRANSELTWVGEIGGPEGHDVIGDMAVDADNHIYLTGQFTKTADLNPTGDVTNVMSAGVSNGYVIKLNGAVHLTISGLNETRPVLMSLYPNPTHDRVYLKHDALSGTSVSVYNIMGDLLLQMPVSDTEVTLDLGTYQKGVYLIEISSSLGTDRKRVILE
jgi:hypothetical protein